ncbi:hypothetical protein JB92DRAFT_3134242 [Gautieria morchelliformis]|nr:hypothetical protein JB92DRAFT_3134242 [Gautieria morchelliformis]
MAIQGWPAKIKFLSSLSPACVLVDWCNHRSLIGSPFTHPEIAQRVTELTGRWPGKSWVARFLKQQSAEGRGLDPVPTESFNLTVVRDLPESSTAHGGASVTSHGYTTRSVTNALAQRALLAPRPLKTAGPQASFTPTSASSASRGSRGQMLLQQYQDALAAAEALETQLLAAETRIEHLQTEYRILKAGKDR